MGNGQVAGGRNPASRIPYLVPRIPHPASRIPKPATRISYPVSRISHPASHMSYLLSPHLSGFMVRRVG